MHSCATHIVACNNTISVTYIFIKKYKCSRNSDRWGLVMTCFDNGRYMHKYFVGCWLLKLPSANPVTSFPAREELLRTIFTCSPRHRYITPSSVPSTTAVKLEISTAEATSPTSIVVGPTVDALAVPVPCQHLRSVNIDVVHVSWDVDLRSVLWEVALLAWIPLLEIHVSACSTHPVPCPAHFLPFLH